MTFPIQETPMSDKYATYLDTVPTWLRSLGEDAEKLGGVLESGSLGTPARRQFNTGSTRQSTAAAGRSRGG